MTANHSQSANQAQAPAQGDKKYFDFLTYGTGLVSRARFVKSRHSKKAPALYCSIAVPLDERGVQNGRWVNFDVRVLGKDNIKLIQSMMPAITDGKRPRVHFCIGDTYADPYSKEAGDKRVTRCQFKGRLIRVNEAKNDPQTVLQSFGLAYVNGFDRTNSKLSLGVIHGQADELQTTYVDASVDPTDPEMTPVIDAVIAAQASQAKMLAGVVLRDMQCYGFVFNDKSKTPGELGSYVNAQLSAVRWLKVEGQLVYKRERPAEQSAADAAPEANSEAPDASSQVNSVPAVANTDDDDGDFYRPSHSVSQWDFDDDIPF